MKNAGANPVSAAAVKAAADRIEAPFSRAGGENSYSLHAELQEVTHNLVGIIRTRTEIEEAIMQRLPTFALAVRTLPLVADVIQPRIPLSI